MTTTQNTPSHPLFRIHGQSTLHGVALIALCFALGASFVSQVWSGSAADGPGTPAAAVDPA